jgi:hypothetical protein
MKIEFTNSFRDIAEKEMGITEKDVIETVTNPMRKQRILFDELEILFFIKKIGKTESYVLVMGQKKGDVFYVRGSCFKIPASFIEEINSEEPLILLQQLALNFGVPIRIGEAVGKFFFREKVFIPKGLKRFEVFSILRPEVPRGLHVISSVFVKFKKDSVECAVAFSIEVAAYLKWLTKKQKIQIKPIVYDVFISYKRRTARDFAVHLKECLTDEGYRAFLDVHDIPKEFEGTSKWFDVRDDAIKNSIRLLLIITIGIETSQEVAEELILARKTPNLKFIYCRHEDLKPEIVIKYGKKEINLGEGNQEKFDTKEDLARKVLKILRDSNNL